MEYLKQLLIEDGWESTSKLQMNKDGYAVLIPFADAPMVKLYTFGAIIASFSCHLIEPAEIYAAIKAIVGE